MPRIEETLGLPDADYGPGHPSQPSDEMCKVKAAARKTTEVKGEFVKDLEILINKHSMENASSTPDFILAEFLRGCLASWNTAVVERSRWYGREAGGGLERDQTQADLAK